MGRGSSFYCKTCKKEYYLGYGSYSTWLDNCKTVEEFDKVAEITDSGDLDKNRNMRHCLAQHAGHDFMTHSKDWSHSHDGKLCGEFGPYGACVTLIEDYDKWEHEDLTKKDKDETAI